MICVDALMHLTCSCLLQAISVTKSYVVVLVLAVVLVAVPQLYVVTSGGLGCSVVQSPQCENGSANGCRDQHGQSRHHLHIKQLYCVNACRLA